MQITFSRIAEQRVLGEVVLAGLATRVLVPEGVPDVIAREHGEAAFGPDPAPQLSLEAMMLPSITGEEPKQLHPAAPELPQGVGVDDVPGDGVVAQYSGSRPTAFADDRSTAVAELIPGDDIAGDRRRGVGSALDDAGSVP